MEELKILSNDSIKGIAMKWYSSKWKEELKEKAVLKYTEHANKKSKKKDSMIIETHQNIFPIKNKYIATKHKKATHRWIN